MSQNEYWNMIGWVIASPSFPIRIFPRTTNRPKHVPPEDPSANVLNPPCSEVIVDPLGSSFTQGLHSLKRLSWNKPLMQISAANAEGIIDILIGPSSVSI